MPTAQALNRKPKSPAVLAPTNPAQRSQPSPTTAPAEEKEHEFVRLHITPFSPALLKSYLAPSVLPLARNISYHSVETFPEVGFGYVELPTMEAQKLKKKLNGSILKGSKVRVEEAKPEKRKALEADAAEEETDERPSKRSKKDKKKKQGVLEGVELPDGRKVKRGWTEPPVKNKKEKAEKEKKDKDKKSKRKESKYTKEPEVLFKAKLTPVAANELEASKKDKKKEKKKDKNKSRREVIVHEFENNTKHASFLKSTKAPTEKKPAVEYVNGKGWVDEDGTVVEPETGRARNRRVLELVDRETKEDVPAVESQKNPSTTAEAQPAKSKSKTKDKKETNGDVAMIDASPPVREKMLSATPEPKSKIKKEAKAKPKKAATPEPSSSEESSSEESSVVSSSDESSDSEGESDSESEAESVSASPTSPAAPPAIKSSTEEEKKEVHHLEALFQRPKPSSSTPTTSTPARLAPIKTSFSFFDDNENADHDAEAGNPPVTPFTKQDLEWRGLRSAAPTPDTAAIGRRFSFPWRHGSQDDDEGEDGSNEADKELNSNTKANAVPATITEEDEDGSEGRDDMEEDDASDLDANATPLGKKRAGIDAEKDGKDSAEPAEESEFAKWFWENRGDNNRAWKKRRREALKMQRLRENRKITSTRRV